MRAVRAFLAKCSGLLQSRDTNRRIDDEIASHLEEATEDFIRRGLSPEDARLAAQLPQAASVDAVPVYLVDPDGYLVLHYRPGFDPAGVRKDLGKLVK